jgi:double-stranded uracil-DNA glycosylase
MTNSLGFPPIENSDARTLILGSMPGQKSFSEDRYYAHPRNSFWPIMCKLLTAGADMNYNDCINLFLTKKIAFWDVLKSCYCEGSLDADIDHACIEPNDFRSYSSEYNQITDIFFNGAKA